MTDLPPTFVKGFHDEAAVRQMTYNRLGKTDLIVSKLSLGTGTLSPFYGNCDEAEAIRTIQQAIRKGINYIDTAYWYGQGKSEQLIGKALKDVPREAYYIGTKVGRYELELSKQFNFTAQASKESVDRSLGYLGLSYVDVIQIHDVEFAEHLDTIINETLPALEDVVKQGKARYVGLTGYSLNVLKKTILRAPGRFDTVLTYARYTLLDDSLLEYLPFFLENNLGVICAAGHAMGVLTNFGSFEWHPAHPETIKQGRLAAEYCKENNIELGKLAMHYFAQINGPATFLVGMQTEKLLNINLESQINGLTLKEDEVLKYILKKICTKKSNWEGVELERFFNRVIED